MSGETSGGNAAVKATAGTIVTYRGVVALTQFAPSNGGHTARGDYPDPSQPVRIRTTE